MWVNQAVVDEARVRTRDLDVLRAFDMTGELPFTIVYNDGTIDITLTNVATPHLINVTPSVTTNYRIVSVTDGNNCVQFPANEDVDIMVLDAIADFSPSLPVTDCSPINLTFTNNYPGLVQLE